MDTTSTKIWSANIIASNQASNAKKDEISSPFL